MLTRRLVSASSKGFTLRHMVTAAVAKGVSDHALSSASDLSATSHPTTTSSRPPVPPVQCSLARSSHVQELVACVNKPVHKTDDKDQSEAVWRMYRLLTRLDRSSLSARELSRILRSVVPRHHNYWKVLYNTKKRDHFRVLSVQVASEWEFRLRTVMQDLAALNSVPLDDWWFVLRTLSNMGLISACEAICREMPSEFRYRPETSEFRLGAIVRWSRNLLDAGRGPRPAQVELAHETFWEIFRHMQSTEINPFTLRLLLSATAEVSTLLQATVDHGETMGRMRTLVNFITQEGYGIDLDNIALSVEAPSNEAGILQPSPKALSAILRHLILRGIEPYRLMSAFDLLSVRQPSSALAARRSLMDDDDDDDFGPSLSPLSADVAARDLESGSLLDIKSANGQHDSPFFGRPTPLLTSSEASEGECEEIPQNRRYRLDFLPPVPSIDAAVISPLASGALPLKPTYNSEGITVILEYLRQQRNPRLFLHFLETALYNAKASQSAWLSSYNTCPPERRVQLYRPLSISPEWFRIALAFSAENNCRWAARFRLSIDDALDWVTRMADTIIQIEKSRGVVCSTPQRDGRPILPTPEFATTARVFRQLHNKGIFIVSVAVRALHHDIDDLKFLASRGRQFESKRVKSHPRPL